VQAYLDHAATSPLRPEALAAMLPFLTEHFGNPSGAHGLAREARRAVDDARERMAGCLGCVPGDIVFTGSGTEADNLALFGTGGRAPGNVVVSAVEHHAVLRAAEVLGAAVVPVDAEGIVDLGALEAVLHPGVTLVSVMLANNETGAVQPLAEVVALVRSQAPGALLHTDAVAAVGCLDPAVHAPGVDLLSLGAHKFGGPKGTGALVVRAGKALAPRLVGGAQERGRRAGTHDVAGIVGMAVALESATMHRADEGARLAGLRDELADGLLVAVPGTTEHGPSRRAAPGRRLPTIVNLGIEGIDDEELLLLLDEEGVAASAGAACASGAAEPSHVLRAMGLSSEQARSAVRFSLGHTTTAMDVGHALAVVPKAVERLRG
jgi:cysteine desulfurase